MEDQSRLYIFAALALIVGVAGGYYYGLGAGNAQGRTELLAEQEAEAELAKVEAQKQLAEEANPFADADANPFEGSYQNPFDTGSNPFSQ